MAISFSFILVNLLCAAVALGIGFVAGAWFLGGKGSQEGTETSTEEKRLEDRLAAERSVMASSRLQDLAHGVATDVGEHNERVGEISASLAQAQQGTAEQQSEGVASALTQIVDANETLQRRLEAAEQQIKAQAEEIQTHESEARTDSLTKIANRRAFDDELSKRFSEWQRKTNPFSLVILDVDHFKKFNDTHGHQAGDEVLRQVAKALEHATRDMDIPCRYGGEEFGVVLPGTCARDAKGLAERIRKGIEDLRIKFEGKTLSVTASVGLAEITAADDAGRLLKRADDALYTSKDAGRNCGHLHDGEKCIPLGGGAAPPATNPQPLPGADTIVTQVLGNLPNRTLFADELRRRVSHCQRSSQELSVLTVELTAYNSLRKNYGDGVAIMTLDSVAQFLQATLREMDLLGRLEDGQFVMMLPDAAREDAELVAERAAAALATCSVPIGDEQLKLETKIGVACLRGDDSAATLMTRAAKAQSEQPLAPVTAG